MLVPGDDPPFVSVCFPESDGELRLRARDGRELVRRLEARTGNAELVARLHTARRSAYPQRFVTEPDDEAALLAALEDAPELTQKRLLELRSSLRSRAE